MKIRIADRLLVALAGLVLLALCAAMVAQVFFQVPLTDYLAAALDSPGQAAIIALAAVAVALLVVGVYCVCMLFRRRKGKRGFVMQQTENGELSIAVKAMESLAEQCVAYHPEMKLGSVFIDADKDGVTVKLRISLASGVSIPLAVGALQKQVRTYLTSCSGVDVKEVRVQVETTSEQAADSPYAVPGLMANPPALLREGDKPVEAVPEEKDPRPVHQRIFGREAQPATMPAPPAETVAPAEPEAPVEAEPETPSIPAEDAPAEPVIEASADEPEAEATNVEDAAEESEAPAIQAEEEAEVAVHEVVE